MTSRSPRALLATASVAVALAAADTYVVVLALTDMMTGVGVGIDALQEATPIISGFLLGYVAVLPLIGRLADLVSRRQVLLGCLLVFVVGSVVTALADDLSTLVTGRVIQGLGGGGLVPATLALVADLWPVGRRGVPLGVVGAVQELGSVVGPVVGAAVLAVAGWREIFWLNAAAGLLLLVAVGLLARPATRARVAAPDAVRRRAAAAVALVALGLAALTLAAPEGLTTDVTLGVAFVPIAGVGSPVATPLGVAAMLLLAVAAGLGAPTWWPVLRRADALGAVLLGTSLGCVILTFAAADPQREVVGPLGLALLPVAALSLALFVWRHRAASEPLIPRGTVGGRTGVALVVSLVVGIALVSVVVDVPLLARLTNGGDEVAAAFVLLRFLVAVPVGALAGGWLISRTGDGVAAGGGLVLASGGLALMSRWGDGALEATSATPVLVAVGIGIGLALAPVNNAALAASPDDAHATASALVVVARMVGMVVGLALLTAVGLHRYYLAVEALPDQTDADALLGAALLQVRTVFGGASVAALVGAVVSVAGLGLRRAGSSPVEPAGHLPL